MTFVLDHCVPARLLNSLEGYRVIASRTLGWDELTNGNLLSVAELAGYSALITVDKGFRSQQNLKGRSISVILLDVPDTTLPGLIKLIPQLEEAMNTIRPGVLVIVTSALR